MKETYYDFLNGEIKNFKDSGEEFDKVILHLPNFFRLLCDLLDQAVLEEDARLLIHYALAYFVIPNDVIPEEVYGAYGYMDDLFICCTVIDKINKDYPGISGRVWGNPDEFPKILDLCLFKTEKFLDEKNLKEKVIEYAELTGKC